MNTKLLQKYILSFLLLIAMMGGIALGTTPVHAAKLTGYNLDATSTISGNVGVAWARLRYYDGSYKTIITDGSGNYSITVSPFWSGTVTPSHLGYTFSPASRSYANVLTNQTAQNYTSTMVKSVSAGRVDSCQLNDSHNLACWGLDNWNTPAGSEIFTQISVGDQHGCGLTNSNTVVCWGFLTPSPALTDTFMDVNATGDSHSCGVKSDGTVVCWGSAMAGETTPPSGTFVQVGTGRYYTCGLKTDNTLTCWGDATDGKSTPPSGSFAQVSTGSYHACALKNDGTLACWGRNASGESTPPSGTFLQVSAGAEHACAIKNDSTLTCWGSNTYGQSTPPTGSYIEVSAGAYHTCAIKNDNTQTCWGRNDASQATPVLLYGSTGVGSASLSYMDGMTKTITSDSSGYYGVYLPYDWSGTITPSKAGYTFYPVSRSYSHLTTSPSNPLNYTATTTVTFTSIDTDDGWILESSSTPGTGGSNDNTTTLFNVGDTASNLEYRSIVSFDTSSIPDNATMVTATLRFKQGGSTGASLLTSYNLWVDMAKGRFGSAFVLQNMDFDAAAVSDGLDNAAYLPWGSTPDANNWFGINLNTTAQGYINLINKTQFRFHFGGTTNNNTANILKFYTGTADNIANGFAPQLTITYSLP